MTSTKVEGWPDFDIIGVGLNATDTMIVVPGFPPVGGKVLIDREFSSIGGQVATAMVTCARLGLRTKYIGTIGDDESGRLQMNSLRQSGINIEHLHQRSNCASQSAWIVIDESTGERTVFWSRPECLALAPSEITDDQITGARLLHIDGHDTPAAERAARIARSKGIPITMDVDTVRPGLERVLPLVDYLIANADFPAQWTDIHDPFDALTALARQSGAGVAAMTLGAQGALAYQNNRFLYSPGFIVNSLDTTGAGDVFHGAFCYAVLQQMSIAEALEFSNAMAALNCTSFGARGGIATLDEAQTLTHSGHPRREHPGILSRIGTR